MARTLRTLILLAGLAAAALPAFAQDPVTGRPGQAAPPEITAPAPVPDAAAPMPKPTLSPATLPCPKTITATYEGHEFASRSRLKLVTYKNGQAVMHDAGPTPVLGTFFQQGDRVIFRFSNCLYEGTRNDKAVSGTACFTSGAAAGKSWTFAVAVR